MAGGTEVAASYGTLLLNDSASALCGFDSALNQTAANLICTGLQITALAAPIAAGFGGATRQAVSFEESIANIGAVPG